MYNQSLGCCHHNGGIVAKENHTKLNPSKLEKENSPARHVQALKPKGKQEIKIKLYLGQLNFRQGFSSPSLDMASKAKLFVFIQAYYCPKQQS